MKDLMVKIKRYLFDKFEGSNKVVLNLGELLKTFSGRVLVLLKEIERISKRVTVRFDWEKYLKDNSHKNTIFSSEPLSASQLENLTLLSVDNDLSNGNLLSNPQGFHSILHSHKENPKLRHYADYLYIDILPKKNLSEEKILFFKYLHRYIKGCSLPFKLPYSKQSIDFKKDITEFADHMNLKPFFFDMRCYSKDMYMRYHTLVGLEEEKQIKINSIGRYGAIITPLLQAQSLKNNIILTYKYQEQIFIHKEQIIHIPGIYTHKLFQTLFDIWNSNKERYINEIDIYECWGYDLEESLRVSKKLRVYHAVRKFNKNMALQLGISDVVQEDKGSSRYRLNPKIRFTTKE